MVENVKTLETCDFVKCPSTYIFQHLQTFQACLKQTETAVSMRARLVNRKPFCFVCLLNVNAKIRKEDVVLLVSTLHKFYARSNLKCVASIIVNIERRLY